MNEPIRLDKRLVELIQCSRGEAQKYIQGGWVRVDGEVEERPQFKVLSQKVELDTNASLAPIEPVTLLLNLPAGFDTSDSSLPLQLITTESHIENDYSGIRLLKNHFFNLKLTAPLQNGASGLLVFTKDRKVLRVLVENNKKKEEEYIVEVSNNIEANTIDQLNSSMNENERSRPRFKISKQSEKHLRFVIEYNNPDQIESVCSSVGLSIVTMKRIRIGRVSMSKLPSGQWRYMATKDLF
jgi:23S rRNA pseudouridine2604 synthase